VNSAGAAAIELHDVVKVHAAGTPRETRALDGVSFSIARGAYVAIVGESGSGKTTLLHLLGALDRPSSGVVRIAGTDLAAARGAELQRLRARSIGFVFQGFDLISALDACENVALAARYAGVARARAHARARDLLVRLGLEARLRHRPPQLSGGQQQRVAIARALVNDPQIVLADEPTGELDSRTAESVLAVLETASRERGATLVVITHAETVRRRADRTIRLADGRVEIAPDDRDA